MSKFEKQKFQVVDQALVVQLSTGEELRLPLRFKTKLMRAIAGKDETGYLLIILHPLRNTDTQ